MFDVWKRMFPTFFLISSILMCFSLCVSNPNPNDFKDLNDYNEITSRQAADIKNDCESLIKSSQSR